MVVVLAWCIAFYSFLNSFLNSLLYVTYVYDDVTYVYDDVTYVYE